MISKLKVYTVKALQILASGFTRHYYTLLYNCNGNKFVCKTRLINCKIHVQGSGHTIELGGGYFKNVNIEISGEFNKLIVSKRVFFNEGGRIVIEDKNCSLRIGEGTDFVSCFFAIRDNGTKVEIGQDCMFSAQTIVRTSDAHSILNEEGKRINYGKDVIIGNHVWVGYGANILKGTSIGNNAIVGTQSVVAGINVPEGSVAAGNPAKIVKRGINWCRKRIP